MKKILAILLTLVMLFVLTACGDKEDVKDTTGSIPTVESSDVTESTDEKETNSEAEKPTNSESKVNMPAYKMAKIDSDNVKSNSKFGISKTNIDRKERDFTDTTFYALSWVFEESEFTESNYNYYDFKIKDVKTGEFFDEMNREHVSIVKYQSTIYNTEEFEGSGVRYYGHDSKKVMVIVLYSDYEIKFEDIEVWVEKEGTDIKLEFNAELSDMTSAPARSTGYSFIKFKDDYYVSDAASSGGGNGGGANYDIYDYISVSNPLSSIDSTEAILDPSKITFYDIETKQHLKAVPETELHYEEDRDSSSIDVEIGVKTEDIELRHSWADRYKIFYDGTILLTQR